MRKTSVILLFCVIFGLLTSASAQDKPRIGVLRFTNHTHAGWWHGTAGTELQDMLTSELASKKTFQVLERKEIDAVFGEQKLSESGLVDEATKVNLGKIKGAKYLVSGTVSAFEEDTSGSGSGFGFMGFSIGKDQKKAYIAVDLKVISVETAEIIDSRTVEATADSGGLSVSGSLFGLSGSKSSQAKTPTGKVIRGCIIEIADYLQCSLIKGRDDACMKEYEAKEAKRREKTKKSIQLE